MEWVMLDAVETGGFNGEIGRNYPGRRPFAVQASIGMGAIGISHHYSINGMRQEWRPYVIMS
ncbi:hypothetical protein PVOR_03545 [Paenibacillus vortex V453]|uniref:Uncharacterized protein n=1 Tax=Paenibacillus vortex V453 TaxID=715225 RepID=A0A2R9T179_9BACL|nr:MULTISPECIES: hypothetical protein [Paenibacillus]EFU43398.1 hypothetical protein PVOR_03545 [Paenibacillus vortex V453]MDH6671219.1 hypothetical protein [Paenibacillus sp. LBL]